MVDFCRLGHIYIRNMPLHKPKVTFTFIIYCNFIVNCCSIRVQPTNGITTEQCYVHYIHTCYLGWWLDKSLCIQQESILLKVHNWERPGLLDTLCLVDSSLPAAPNDLTIARAERCPYCDFNCPSQGIYILCITNVMCGVLKQLSLYLYISSTLQLTFIAVSHPKYSIVIVMSIIFVYKLHDLLIRNQIIQVSLMPNTTSKLLQIKVAKDT